MKSASGKYLNTAELASSRVIDSYSTSFGLATSLLGPRHRKHVRNIYALVRVADELVDGAAEGFGLDPSAQLTALNSYEQQTMAAIESGYSSDLIIQAFAATAREATINKEVIAPFFESMRIDAEGSKDDGETFFDESSHAKYVYGSAEAVGLMCLRVFLRDENLNEADKEAAEKGARSLGAAFQNINFLRDLGEDTNELNRSYLTQYGRLSEAEYRNWLAQIDSDLAEARASLKYLPKDSRLAVRCALNLFAELTKKLKRVEVAKIYETRIRVSDFKKILLLVKSFFQNVKETR